MPKEREVEDLSIEEGIQRLKEYFEKEENTLIAFLFGSFAKDLQIEESDFDIAVYLKEEEKEEDIWFDVSKIIEKEVDLILLNTAPATLVSGIFRTGRPLVIKDKGLFLELYLKATSEAEDFSKFLEDFWEIYQRTESLAPEERDRLLIRFQFLDKVYRETENFKKMTPREYTEDIIKRRNVERWAEVVVNALIDISKIILASEKREMPRSYEESLSRFGLLIGLNEEEVKQLSSFANLRNILAHEYLDILYQRIQKFIKEFSVLYKKIFDFLEKYLRTRED